MNRLNQILAGFLVLQLIVVGIILWPRPAATGGEGQSLFPDLQSDRVVGLTITDAQGRTVHLAKSDGGWVFPDADNYPVEADKVPALLDKIVGLKADRLVTETSGSQKRLKVADSSFERLIELELDDGTHYRLYVGSSPSFGAAHVRAGDQDQVYLTSSLSTQDVQVEATAWADRIYLSVPRDQAVAFTLQNANGSFEFEKSGDAWTMKGLGADETLKETVVQTLLNRATSVAMTQPLGKEEKETYGLKEPKAVVTLWTHSEEGADKTYTLRVGDQNPEDNTFVVISSESPYYVRVAEFSVKDFVDKARGDLIEPPATPTAMPETTPAGQ